jgi:NAD(P)-dependent dehydrogenase (short-subunit alcohol dehydrogenase family)
MAISFLGSAMPATVSTGRSSVAKAGAMKYGAVYPSLKGRTVVVTGGASGIGEAIVAHFAAQGSKVGFIDIDRKAGETLAAKLRRKRQKVHFVHADLTDTEALRGAIAEIRKAFGPVTILINNAGHDERHRLEAVTPAYFDERIAVNLKHQLFCIQAVVPDMKAAGYGSIVNMTSTSYMMGSVNMPVYTAAKAAVVGLTRGLARELGRHNIRVNAFAPGWIMTKRQLDLWVNPDSDAEREAGQCLKRRLYPDDMARAVLFLASDEASSATNQTFVFDAGWL